MISGKLLATQLEKFLKSPVCQNARVMVKLPHGEYRSPDGYFDILSVSLLENNILLHREPHRIVFYLIELSSMFHSLWSQGREEEELRFFQKDNIDLTFANLT